MGGVHLRSLCRHIHSISWGKVSTLRVTLVGYDGPFWTRLNTNTKLHNSKSTNQSIPAQYRGDTVWSLETPRETKEYPGKPCDFMVFRSILQHSFGVVWYSSGAVWKSFGIVWFYSLGIPKGLLSIPSVSGIPQYFSVLPHFFLVTPQYISVLLQYSSAFPCDLSVLATFRQDVQMQTEKYCGNTVVILKDIVVLPKETVVVLKDTKVFFGILQYW